MASSVYSKFEIVGGGNVEINEINNYNNDATTSSYYNKREIVTSTNNILQYTTTNSVYIIQGLQGSTTIIPQTTNLDDHYNKLQTDMLQHPSDTTKFPIVSTQIMATDFLISTTIAAADFFVSTTEFLTENAMLTTTWNDYYVSTTLPGNFV